MNIFMQILNVNYGRVHGNITCYSKRQKGNVYYSQTQSITLIKFNSWNLTGMVCFTVIPAFILLEYSFSYHFGALHKRQKSKWYLYLLFWAAAPKWMKSVHLFVHSSIPLGLPKSKSGLWGPPLTLPPTGPPLASEGRYEAQTPYLEATGRGGRTDRRMDKQMDGWMDKHMDRNSPCVLQDFVPFGGAALLSFDFNKSKVKPGKGTNDHILPVGDWFLQWNVGWSVIS